MQSDAVMAFPARNRRLLFASLCGLSLVLACVVGCAGPAGPAAKAEADCAARHVTAPIEFTVATFNIHDGRGRDERFDLDRIAAVLPEADFVGLQEASRGNLRTGFADEPKKLAAKWGHSSNGLFTWDERPIWDGGGLFGNGYTTSLPVLTSGEATLPEIEGKGRRGLGWVETRFGDREVFFFVTHITLPKDATSDAHWPQIEAILVKIDEICGDGRPCVLMGDFNAYPGGPVIQRLLARFDEVLIGGENVAASTRRDYIFVTRQLKIVAARLLENDASDHPAVWCRLRLE